MDLRNDLSLRYIPVILLTAIAREAQTLANTGGIESTVIAKPVQLQDLIEIIESHLNAAKSFNQVQEETSGISGHHHHNALEELPDFDQEIPWGHESSGKHGPGGEPSISFSPHFPARDEQNEPSALDAAGFAFPSRTAEDQPSENTWKH
jgi:hypothetical protein